MSNQTDALELKILHICRGLAVVDSLLHSLSSQTQGIVVRNQTTNFNLASSISWIAPKLWKLFYGDKTEKNAEDSEFSERCSEQ